MSFIDSLRMKNGCIKNYVNTENYKNQMKKYHINI
jgi:hypothetical protein